MNHILHSHPARPERPSQPFSLVPPALSSAPRLSDHGTKELGGGGTVGAAPGLPLPRALAPCVSTRFLGRGRSRSSGEWNSEPLLGACLPDPVPFPSAHLYFPNEEKRAVSSLFSIHLIPSQVCVCMTSTKAYTPRSTAHPTCRNVRRLQTSLRLCLQAASADLALGNQRYALCQRRSFSENACK